MYRKSNFSRLIDRLATERRNRSNVVPSLIRMQKSTAANKMHYGRLIKSMRKLKRDLTPTRDELKMENRQRMDHFKKSLALSVKTGKVTSLEAIKCENAAHKISTQLAARGLI